MYMHVYMDDAHVQNHGQLYEADDDDDDNKKWRKASRGHTKQQKFILHSAFSSSVTSDCGLSLNRVPTFINLDWTAI